MARFANLTVGARRTPSLNHSLSDRFSSAAAADAAVKAFRGRLLAFLPWVLTLMLASLNFNILRQRNFDARHVAPAPITTDGIVSSPLKLQLTSEVKSPQELPSKGRRFSQTTPDDIKKKTNNTSLAPTVSACLLIKDDNDLLNEWIAYHYFALNMRTLVVAVDPTSQQSPTRILEKWRSEMDVILEWHDVDYMPVEFLTTKTIPRKYVQSKEKFSFPNKIAFPLESEEALTAINTHRYRQRVFLAKCMKAVKEMHGAAAAEITTSSDSQQQWLFHVDSDEFLTSSKLLRKMKPKWANLPPADQPGSILTLLQSSLKTVHHPCMSLLRLMFGSVESSEEELAQHVPENFNPKSFETLRWTFHARPQDEQLRGNPKVLMDMAAIPLHAIPDVVFSIHRPIRDFCVSNHDASLKYENFRALPLTVNHYLGSWERYSARQDPRRTRDVYDEKATHREGRDDGNRLWLQGFVNQFGSERAAELLGDEHVLHVSGG